LKELINKYGKHYINRW